MIKIKLLDKDLEEIETSFVDCNLIDAFNMITNATDICCGTDRIKCSKKDYVAIDFEKSIIYVEVEFPSE